MFNEIYNYRRLRNDLESRGARFLTASDTEVILEGWRIEGEAIHQAGRNVRLRHLGSAHRGMDLARPVGIKPLYLSQPMPGTIAFASEIKPLLADRKPYSQLAGPLRISALQLVSWASDHIRGIRHLEPGHLVRWNPTTATSVRDAIAALTASSDRFARPTLRMPFGRSSIVR